jgi:chromosome partitioning protein
MKVVALLNRKGGVGKTTSAGYLAMVLQQAGQPVLGLDLDPERSWLSWHAVGALPYTVKGIYLSELEKEIAGFEGYVVIDSPPNDRDALEDIPMLADECIVPMAATAFDLNRLGNTLKAIARAEKLREKALGSVLITRYRGNLTMSQEVTAMLQEHKAPLLEAKIRELTRYTNFDTPIYLEEYEAVARELELI